MAADVRETIERFFRARPQGVTAVYLFGSSARETASRGSDVDVAVLFTSTPDATLTGPALTLAGELERQIRKPVDLIVLNTAPADLVHRILRDGEVVIDVDRAARIRFEVYKRNEYFDLEPIRRRYRQPRAAHDRPGARP
jgi:predicted nucleotidyltransferase